jgi:peptidoglycan/LPS O-acetylase OafA/YrhL
VRERPRIVPFAVVFAVLVAAEDLYLARLLWTPEGGWDRFVLGPVALAAMALVGAALVFLGRGRGWLVLAVAAVLPLLGLMVVTVLFAADGGGRAMWSALLLCVGPMTCLVLALRRPVREWSGHGRANRSHGGRRPVGSAR